MPLSVGLVEGWEKCVGLSTKVCCWSEKCGDGVQGSARCGGWATKVCCGVENCGDGWSERFVGW